VLVDKWHFKKSSIWDTVVIVTNLRVLPGISRLRYSESASEMKLEKNDKEGGGGRGKAESAHSPRVL